MSEARLQAHHAAQWLARAARAYVPEQPDDGHTNLGWNDGAAALVTHALKNGEQVALQLPDLVLSVMDPYAARPPRRFALNGRTNADVRAWLGGELGATGLDPGALDAPAPYDIPSHAVASGARYLTKALFDALAELAAWYGNANLVLDRLRHDLRARKLAAPPVRCWPHHFDLDTLVSFGTGEGARSMGAGFSPGDHYYDEPYFYVSLYPGPDVAGLPRLPSVGHWHTRDFTGAVVPAHKLVRLREQEREIEAVLRTAAEAALKTLA